MRIDERQHSESITYLSSLNKSVNKQLQKYYNIMKLILINIAPHHH
jgi:hypothetical protein